MTSLTVTNHGLGPRSLKNAEQRVVLLNPGDSKTIDVHPHHAFLMLKDAAKPNPTFQVDIDPDERADMEQQLAESRAASAPPTRVRGQPLPAERRFITDPRTVSDERAARANAAAYETASQGTRQPTHPKAAEKAKKSGVKRVPIKQKK